MQVSVEIPKCLANLVQLSHNHRINQQIVQSPKKCQILNSKQKTINSNSNDQQGVLHESCDFMFFFCFRPFCLAIFFTLFLARPPPHNGNAIYTHIPKYFQREWMDCSIIKFTDLNHLFQIHYHFRYFKKMKGKTKGNSIQILGQPFTLKFNFNA